MANVIERTVFISCCRDCDSEAKKIIKICHNLSNAYRLEKLLIRPIYWEEDVVPLITGTGAQDVIDQQIGDYDIYLGLMWKRYGYPNARGISPTQTEFEDAYTRQQNTGKPIIQFYFKDEGIDANSVDEQIQKVLAFKQHVKDLDLGLYNPLPKDDREFQDLIYRNIIRIIHRFDEWTHKKIVVSKIHYPPLNDYIKRQVCSAENYDSMKIVWSRDEIGLDLLELIKQKNHKIALIGDPASGKSTELTNIASQLSKEDSVYYPVLIKLNHYTNQKIEELIQDSINDWEKIPKNQLVLLLDGLDEIESKNELSAIRIIEAFSETHPEMRIIISCRTVFYETGTDDKKGTLDGFTPYFLLDLTYDQSQEFINGILGDKGDDFNSFISTNQLNEFILKPFYLRHLLQLFNTDDHLPTNISQIFEKLLESQFTFDANHFRTTITLTEKKKVLLHILEIIALSMETFGRNYLTQAELQKIIPERTDRDLIKYSKLLRKSIDNKDNWQFEYNIYQEYLSARILSRQKIETIKQFLTLPPARSTINPTWANTLQLLLELSDDSQLITWLLNEHPDYVVKIRPEKIGEHKRNGIFISIFNEYKSRKIPIDRDKYKLKELAQFSESPTSIDFLLNTIETCECAHTISDGIQLLSYMTLPHRYRSRAQKILIKLACSSNEDYVKNRALLALSDLRFNDKITVDYILSQLKNSDNSRVRYGLYYLVHNSAFLNENIEIFLEGIHYTQYPASASFDISFDDKKIRSGEESWHLKIGLEKANSLESLNKIFTYFSEHSHDLDNPYFSKCVEHFSKNSITVYQTRPEIFNDLIDFLIALTRHYQDNTAPLLIFFEKTQTKLAAIKKILQKVNENWLLIRPVALLADNEESYNYIIEEYLSKKLDDSNMWFFQSVLKQKNPYCYQRFNSLINAKTNNKFVQIEAQPKEINTTQRSYQEQAIEQLFDTDAIINEVLTIFDSEGKSPKKGQDSLIFRNKIDDTYSRYAVEIWEGLDKKEKIRSRKTLENRLKLINWERFWISTAYDLFGSYNDSPKISPAQREEINNWCQKNIEKANFTSAITIKSNNSFSIGELELFLWVFLRKLDLSYPKEKLLELVSFDAVEDNKHQGIEYLEKMLTVEEITEIILKNLENQQNIPFVLNNYFIFAKKHKIIEVIPYALEQISNNRQSLEVRLTALNTVVELSRTSSELEQILPRIKGEFRWEVVGKLLKNNNTFIQKYLESLISRGTPENKLHAAICSMYIKNIKGLKYYIKRTKEENRYLGTFVDRPAISQYTDKRYLPYLIELLETTYQKNFANSDMSILRSSILDTITNIALSSEDGFNLVNTEIRKFIELNHDRYDNIQFLYSFVESVERKYLITISQKKQIQDIIDLIVTVE